MRPRKWIVPAALLAGGVVVGGLCAGWVVIPHGRADHSARNEDIRGQTERNRSEHELDELATTNARLAALEDAVRESRTSMMMARSKERARADESSSPASDGGLAAARARFSKLSQEEQQDVANARAFETFDQKLASEPIDTAWAADYTNQVKHFVEANSPWKVANMSCGQTLCRFEAEYANDEDRESYIHRLLGQGPLSSSIFFAPAPDGRGTIVYVSRAGYGLPQVQVML